MIRAVFRILGVAPQDAWKGAEDVLELRDTMRKGGHSGYRRARKVKGYPAHAMKTMCTGSSGQEGENRIEPSEGCFCAVYEGEPPTDRRSSSLLHRDAAADSNWGEGQRLPP
jgi:hypothetical protein